MSRAFARRSTRGTSRPRARCRVLERFVAAVVVIGLLLWGASMLATPDEERDVAPGPDGRGSILPRLDEPATRDAPGDDDEDDDDEDDDDREGSSNGRRGSDSGSG